MLFDFSEHIPPAVLHTILENGITHSRPYPDGKISFHLEYISTADYKQYILKTIAINRQSNGNEREGTGFKYIKARLEENYGDNWKLKSKEVTSGWETSITILK